MDYNYKSSLFHRISEFHYFSELLDNKIDNMLEHPWTELQLLIKEKWLTQKAFSSILWKKVSEVNELLKWKRNITIQRDYLLHQTLWTPIKYWILKQIDYDYSLIDIEESSSSPLDKEGLGEIWSHPEALAEKSTEQETSYSEPEEHKDSEIVPLDEGDTAKPSGFELPEETETQETPTQKPENKIDEDLQNRASIFRSF